MKALSRLDTPAPSSIFSNLILGAGAGSAAGVAGVSAAGSLLLAFLTDFFTPSGSVPVSVSDVLACLLLGLGVLCDLFTGLRKISSCPAPLSLSLSSVLALADLLLALALGVGGGGISSSSAAIVLSCESASVMPLLVRRARARAFRILRDCGRTCSLNISIS